VVNKQGWQVHVITQRIPGGYFKPVFVTQFGIAQTIENENASDDTAGDKRTFNFHDWGMKSKNSKTEL